MKPRFTTERFYMEHAEIHGKEVTKRHLNRYKWAASKVPVGGYVLDAGCGSGYGDYILRGKASFVFGIDSSPEAILYANKKAAATQIGGLQYDCQDLRRPDLDGTRYDAVVCLEVIEHVSRDDQDKILVSLKRVLNKDGVLAITTPEKTKKGKMTPHHIHEMGKKEFDLILLRHFKKVEYDIPYKFGIPHEFMLATCSVVKK